MAANETPAAVPRIRAYRNSQGIFRNHRSTGRNLADIVERGGLRRNWKCLRIYRVSAGSDCTGEATDFVDSMIDARIFTHVREPTVLYVIYQPTGFQYLHCLQLEHSDGGSELGSPVKVVCLLSPVVSRTHSASRHPR
jgi:hypothetical protein